MAGIGEASAIVGVIQVGFSLATALNTYISDVSDAGDDISSLVSAIEATFGQLRDLGRLIEKNETTKAWSEDGLRNAKKCVTDCEKIIIKLRKLLKKSTVSATSEEVDRNEIDISKLERALWPFIKPQMEVRRRELQSIKQDIMIAYSSYMTEAGTDAERKKYTDDLPGLQRTRALARRQVREAKEHRRRQVSSRQRKLKTRAPMQVPLNNVPPEPAWAYDRNGLPYRLYMPGASTSDDGRGSVLDEDEDDDEPLIYNNVDELEREFEAWKAEDEQRKANDEAARKTIQEEAVKTWKEQQLREAEVRRQKNEDERSSLRAELNKQRIAPQQIEDIVNHVHPPERVESDLHLLSRAAAAADKASSVVSSDGPAESTSSRRWSIWSKNKSNSAQRSSTANTLVNEPRGTLVPDILKDPTAEGGMAPLEASYFQRSLGVPPSIQNFNVEIPDQWLLDSVIKKQAAIAHDPKKINSVWKQFSQLPDDYRHAIGEHISYKFDYSERGVPVRWVLLHLECIFEKRRRNMLDRGRREEVVGVYLVLKQNKKPRDHSAERVEIVVPHDNNDEYPRPRSSRGIMRPQSTYEFPARHRSSKSVYEPHHSQSYSRKESSGSKSRHARAQSHQEDYKRLNSDRAHRAERRHRASSPDIYIGRSPPIFIHSDRRWSHDRDRIQRGHPAPEPVQLPKTVSFTEPEDRPAAYPHAYYPVVPAPYPSYLPPSSPPPPTRFQTAYPTLPYPYFNPLSSPGLRPSTNDEIALYSTSWAPDQRLHSPRRSRSRSRSPRPIRRISTDESYGSYKSLRSPTRGLQALGYATREETERLGPQPLSDIQEISAESDGSISSEDSEEAGPSSRPGRWTRETDEELLNKTLKEYVNPLRPRQVNAGSKSPMSATRNAEESGEQSSATAFQKASSSSKEHEQPTVEEIFEEVGS